jgi:ferredoxin
MLVRLNGCWRCGVCREDLERIGRLKPEERINLAIGMSDVCIRVCAEGVRNANPSISEKELVERVRERLMFDKRRRSGGLSSGSF